MDTSDYDMASVSNVYIDNADEDSEASSFSEFLDTLSPLIQNRDAHSKTNVSKTSTQSANRIKPNSGNDAPKCYGTSSDTIVIIDSDSESEEKPALKVPTDQHSDAWLNAFNRKISAQQQNLIKDVPKVTKKKSTVNDHVIADENILNSESNEDLVTTSPEADLGYCEGDDVDDNGMSWYNGIHKTLPTTSVNPSTSESSGTPVSKSQTVGRKSKQNKMYYCTECRAIFSEQHEHDQTYQEEQIKERLTCDFCHEEFFSQLDYSQHGKSCSRRCTCHFCGHIFNDIVQLKQHLFTEHAISKDNASTSNVHAFPSSPENKHNFSEYSTFSSDLDTSKSEPVEQLVDSTKFPCSICCLVFSNACNLKRHTSKQHSSQKKRRKKGRVRLSFTKRQNKPRYSQVKSNLVTKPEKSTNSSVNSSYQQQETSTCDFCQKQFMSAEEYSAHCKNCTIRCTCPFCGKAFQAMKELRKHMFTHHDLSDDESELAGETAEASSPSAKPSSLSAKSSSSFAKSSSTKKQNTASKVKKKKLYCLVCKRSWNDALLFKKHQQKHLARTQKAKNKGKEALSPSQKRQLITKNSKDKSKNILGSQMNRKQAHLPEKKYKCDECGKCISNFCNLKRHKKIHAKHKAMSNINKDQSRNILGSQMNRKQAHFPEKKYKCDECGKCISNFCNLKRHKKIHAKHKAMSNISKDKAQSPEKCVENFSEKKKSGKFRCGICGEFFNHLFNLERHAMTHSEPTPYQCQVCFTRFSELQHLQSHFEKFHIMDN